MEKTTLSGRDAKTEWENIEDQGQRNMETVNKLAEKYNAREGKWFLHISSEWVDKVRIKISEQRQTFITSHPDLVQAGYGFAERGTEACYPVHEGQP